MIATARAAVGALAVIALSASENLGGQEAAHDATAFTPGPCTFFTHAEAARFRVECGKLRVPQSDSGGRDFLLQVAVLRALTDVRHGDAIVVIPGGPGQPIIERSAAYLARHPLQDTLRQHRDIVLLDPRGTGWSEPGELCPAFASLEARVSILRLPFAERTELVERRLAECRARLLEQGIDPAHFGSASQARDLERLRVALGYDGLNLIGVSWGTRVELEMMRRFPGSVRSAILYGPFAPDGWSSNGLAARNGPALGRLLRACESDTSCHAEFPDLRRELALLHAELATRPQETETEWGPYAVDPATADAVITYAMYDSDLLPYVPLAIREMRRGNMSIVDLILRGAVGEGSSGGVYYAGYCTELAPPISADSLGRLHELYPWSGHLDRFPPDASVVCPSFVPTVADSTALEPVRSEVPTLIFVGELDPTTPLEYGRRIAASLPNATLVPLPGRGHDVNVPMPCTVKLRRNFLDQPRAPLDTSCVAELPPLRFATGVHANSDVPRFLARLSSAPQPLWNIGAALVALALLVGAVLLPMRSLRDRSGQPRTAVAAALVIGGTAALALLLAVGLTAAVALADPPVLLFGVPRAWQWIFAMFPILVMFAVLALIATILAWIRRWWTMPTRLFGTLTVAATVVLLVLGRDLIL